MICKLLINIVAVYDVPFLFNFLNQNMLLTGKSNYAKLNHLHQVQPTLLKISSITAVI